MDTTGSNGRIVVTGLGAVTPLGHNVTDLWQALLAGRDGISDVDRFDLGGMACTRGGLVRCYLPPPLLDATRPCDLATGFAAGACLEALAQAGGDPHDLGLVTASNFGSIDEAENGLAGAAPGMLRACCQDTTAERLAAAMRLNGPRIALSLSCAAGAAAIAHAASLIRHGRCRRMLVVGYDAISRYAWSGLCSLRTMTRDAVRPFDLNRSGTIFSEGAAALMLESGEAAAASGARPLATVLGWGTGNNGFHMTAPAGRGAGTAHVMRQALRSARLPPGAVDHINAHGTGTKPNDSTESQAILDVFGPRGGTIPVTSIKSSIGHLLGAAGTVESVASILSLRDGVIPPTTHFTTPDPECAVDLVANAPRKVALRTVLSNSAGFGGCNAAVIFGKA